MLDGLLLWMLGMGLRGVGLEGSLPLWLEKLGKGLLLVVVAPIVLVQIVIVFFKALFEALVVYSRTGTWPRNEAFIARKKKEAATGARG